MENPNTPGLPRPPQKTLAELEQEEQALRKSLKYWPFIIGLLVGVALYSLVKNGLSWPTFLPLLAFLPPRRIQAQLKQVRAEMEQARARQPTQDTASNNTINQS